MKLVIDASVAVKWFLWDVQPEADHEIALRIFAGIADGTITSLEPPHWTAEVLAVIARARPGMAGRCIGLLSGLPVSRTETETVYLRAAELSQRLKHHFFDTLYHAVAIEQGVTLVTADERYLSVARQDGAIVHLRDLKITP